MTLAPILALHHNASLSVGGIVRYRIKVLPSQVGSIESLQFRIRNSSPIYRNIALSSGPWKLSVALVRNPDKSPSVPELVPSIGCAQVCRLDAKVDKDSSNEGSNEWELEVMSEMILQNNWIDFKVEVFAVLRDGVEAQTTASDTSIGQNDVSGGETDKQVQPQVLRPQLVTCQYKDTKSICGPKKKDGDNLHLVLLTHGVHGSWLDMLYIKEQIDLHTGPDSKTVTFLTDTNHAGTEEGIQMAGRRVALDILEFTGFCDTEQGKHLRRQRSSQGSTRTNGPPPTDSLTTTSSESTTENRNASGFFPRGFSKVSIIGHSLGGLLNIYALGYIEEVTKGEFFKTIQPVHFITMASPLLGIGFEHPWVLGYALSVGCIGQTGKDLALQDRSNLAGRSSSSSPSSTPSTLTAAHASDGASTTPTTRGKTTQDCDLDKGPEPLLLAMARPGSVSNRVLVRFADRTSYANIENDMAVRFNTSSMMGIPSFDLDQFFSPDGQATAPRKNMYSSALTSTMALLFPKIPPKAKFLGVQNAPSPVMIVSHVDATPEMSVAVDSSTTTKSQVSVRRSSSKSSKLSSGSSKSAGSSHSASSSSSSSQKSISSLSRANLAQLVAEGYHQDMDWTKIGVFIESEAHVQIIVRRKWYNLDGWKCVQDLVERFDFS